MKPEPKRPQGRPPVPPELAMHLVSIRMNDAQRAKLARLGGSQWVRRAIERAKEIDL